MEDVGNGRSADIDLQAHIHCIANLGVTPGEIFVSDPDDEIANLFGLGRTALLPARLRAVVFLGEDPAKPLEDGSWSH